MDRAGLPCAALISIPGAPPTPTPSPHPPPAPTPTPRFPFLLVDRVVEWEYGKYAVGYKCVTINDNFFPGHFPQRAIMPGVVGQGVAGAVAREPRAEAWEHGWLSAGHLSAVAVQCTS